MQSISRQDYRQQRALILAENQRYFFKLLYMHVNFAIRITAESFAERSLSLLTMRNKAFMQQPGHIDTLTLVK